MSDQGGRVLLVDDDVAVRTVLAALLEQAGITSEQAASGEEALTKLSSGRVDVMITDLRMPGLDGMELLARVVQGFPEVPVIVLTAHGSVSVAVEAMRRGATDFVEKPFDRDDVLEVVQTALLKARELDEPPPASTAARSLLGDSPT